MGEPHPPLPVKLVIGLITGETPLFEKIQELLRKRFGPVDDASAIFNFDKTDYYAEEMGRTLKRGFLSFRRLIAPEGLVKIKLATNALEKKFKKGPYRRINIDPGYVTLSKLVLASTKNFCHRIYAGDGIFEEITLTYKGNGFKPGPCTYPDYASPEHIAVFNRIRDIYRSQIEEKYGLSALSRCV